MHLHDEIRIVKRPNRGKVRKHLPGTDDLDPVYGYMRENVMHVAFSARMAPKCGEHSEKKPCIEQQMQSESADEFDTITPRAASAAAAVSDDDLDKSTQSGSEQILKNAYPKFARGDKTHSYSFSQRTVEQQYADVCTQIADMISVIQKGASIGDVIATARCDYTRPNGSPLFENVYILNIFPLQTFTAQRDEPIRIAINTVIAKEHDRIHIFFDDRHIFEHSQIPEWKIEMVYDFNRRIRVSDVPKYATICRNLSMLVNIVNGIQIITAIDAEPIDPDLYAAARAIKNVSLICEFPDHSTVTEHQSLEYNERFHDHLPEGQDIPAEPASPVAPASSDPPAP